jgi:hypothetical protein
MYPFPPSRAYRQSALHSSQCSRTDWRFVRASLINDIDRVDKFETNEIDDNRRPSDNLPDPVLRRPIKDPRATTCVLMDPRDGTKVSSP